MVNRYPFFLDPFDWRKDTHGNIFKICAVLLTRPSYQGVMSDAESLKAAISCCHSRNIPVIVDEAHGAHVRFLGSSSELKGISHRMINFGHVFQRIYFVKQMRFRVEQI